MRHFPSQFSSSSDEETLEEANERIGRYEAHVDSIREHLSPGLLDLVDYKFHLHDAHVEDFTCDPVGKTLTFHLTLGDAEGSAFECVYHGLRAFCCVHANDQVRNFANHGAFDDLLIDELELHGPGDFEHFLLFATGIELHIRFENFSYTLNAPKAGADPDPTADLLQNL